jgi:hypothetical protein
MEYLIINVEENGMKRYFVYSTLIIFASHIYAADTSNTKKATSGKTSLWKPDDFLDATIKKQEQNKLAANQTHEIIDICNTADNNLLILGKGLRNALLGFGAEAIITLTEYNPKTNVTEMELINLSGIKTDTLALLNQNYFLGYDDNKTPTVYKKNWGVRWYYLTASHKLIEHTHKNIAISGNYPSYYWACSTTELSKECSLYRSEKRIPIGETAEINYAPTIATLQLTNRDPKAPTSWTIKDQTIIKFPYIPEENTKKSDEPVLDFKDYTAESGNINFPKQITQLLPYSEQAMIALAKEPEGIFHVTLKDKKYSIISLKIPIDPIIKLALCYNKDSKIVLYALTRSSTNALTISHTTLDSLLKKAEITHKAAVKAAAKEEVTLKQAEKPTTAKFAEKSGEQAPTIIDTHKTDSGIPLPASSAALTPMPAPKIPTSLPAPISLSPNPMDATQNRTLYTPEPSPTVATLTVVPTTTTPISPAPIPINKPVKWSLPNLWRSTKTFFLEAINTASSRPEVTPISPSPKLVNMTRSAEENESLALEKNPYPWDKFLKKSSERIKNEKKVARAKSYAKKIENFLGEKSSKRIEHIMGKKIVTMVTDSYGAPIFEDFDSYEFPNTKEGKRAQFLQVLYDENALTYKDIWLKEIEWYLLDKKTKKKLENELTKANNGTMPNFREFWLPRYSSISDSIKNTWYSVKKFVWGLFNF